MNKAIKFLYLVSALLASVCILMGCSSKEEDIIGGESKKNALPLITISYTSPNITVSNLTYDTNIVYNYTDVCLTANRTLEDAVCEFLFVVPDNFDMSKEELKKENFKLAHTCWSDFKKWDGDILNQLGIECYIEDYELENRKSAFKIRLILDKDGRTNSEGYNKFALDLKGLRLQISIVDKLQSE